MSRSTGRPAAASPGPAAADPTPTRRIPAATDSAAGDSAAGDSNRTDAGVEPAILATDVAREYRTGGEVVRALRGVSLRIEVGEYAAIVGPSGSGKSTLMHVLGCLDRPTSGSVRVAGQDIGRTSDTELARIRNEHVGFVFQQFHLLARTTATDNVALPLLYRGVPSPRRREAAAEALEAVGLGHRLRHTPNQLSGGEQQRVAVARAIVGRPRILLADEPTGNLDSRNGEAVMALLEELVTVRGVAVVLVTHDAEVAARAWRRIRMRDGLIAEDTGVARPSSGGVNPPGPEAES